MQMLKLIETQIVDDPVKVSRTSFKAKQGKCHMRRLLRGPADDLQHKAEQWKPDYMFPSFSINL